MIEKIIKIGVYKSPCGNLLIGDYDGKLCLCDWIDVAIRTEKDLKLQKRLNARFEYEASDIVDMTMMQLNEYFERKRTAFDIPLLHVGTDFQKCVWSELLNIPYGATISYHELACRVGNHNASRAVASANRCNPISIIVPCHRVIGANGTLTGYAGCKEGLSIKEYLLKLEQML